MQKREMGGREGEPTGCGMRAHLFPRCGISAHLSHCQCLFRVPSTQCFVPSEVHTFLANMCQ